MNRRDFEHKFIDLYLPLGMYALRMVEKVEVAEDIVQDAFMKAWELTASGNDIVNLKAWVYRCVHNLAIDYLRRQAMSPVDIADYDEVLEDDVDTSERDARVWKAIDNLPERCREVFLLSKRDGLSNEEIARELSISVKTVKNQMTKALGRLREALGCEVSASRPSFLPFL